MKQVRKSLSKIVVVMLIAAMLIQPYGVQETKAENSTYGINNPVITSTVTIWDSIYFGTYNNEKIRWRVLDVNGEDAFLFSESVLDVQPFHSKSDNNVSWATSSLRTWLNSTFLDKAFTEDEKKQIMIYSFEADTNPKHATSFPWSVTVDQVSLPSVKEVSMEKYGFESVYNIASATRETETSTGVWWLRTNGSGGGLIADVAEDGCGVYTGISTWNELTGEARTAGIRPVIHLNLKGANFENAGSIKKMVERNAQVISTDAPTQQPSTNSPTQTKTPDLSTLEPSKAPTASPDKTPVPSNDFEDDAEIPKGYEAIATIDDLAGIRNNLEGKYILTRDIDLSETKSGGLYDSGNGWRPIEDFAGVLDGNGHKIKGMHIFGELEECKIYDVGLFANLNRGAVIERLGMTGVDIDVTIKTGSPVGAIAGRGYTCSVSECYVEGIIKVSGVNSEYTYVGGLIGDLEGYAIWDPAQINNCYNLINIDSEIAKRQGGICGRIFNTKLEKCYNMGKINDGNNGGAIFGTQELAYGSISDCFYLKGSAKKDSLGTSLSEAQMKNLKNFTNFDSVDVWDIDSNSGTPYPQLKRNPQVRLKEMKIKHNPVKGEYNQGDQISLQGGDVELQYENGKTMVVSMDETMLGNYDMMKIGKQTIEVKRLNKTASFTINVNPIPVKQITLDRTQLVLKKGETATLTAIVFPENATNKDVEWSSQNSSIARIDQNGKITAVSPGNTVIEAKSESTGTVIATCNLSVIVTCDSLSIINKTVWDDDAGEYCITLNPGNTLQLKCDVSPSDASEAIIWQSENPAVANVNGQGSVIAVGPGTTRITVRSESGETASIYIYVRGTTSRQEESETNTTHDSSYTHNAEQSKTLVRPGNTRVKKLKSVKKRLWIQWSKAKNAKYYQVVVATNKSFTKGLKGGKLTGLKGWCKIKRKKTYYVRVRAISSTGLVGKWSKAKKIKCK